MSNEVRLVIEDGDLALWRPINNTFACPDLERVNWKRYWNGLLIQLGDYLEFRHEEVHGPKGGSADPGKERVKGPRHRRTFASLQFRDDGDKPLKTRPYGEFKWLNICAARENRKVPIRRFNDAQSDDLLGRGGDSTRRPRRKSFLRFASITYWHNRDGYDISVREHYVGGRLTLKYVFTLPDVETIEIGNGGKPLREETNGISTIVVNTVRHSLGPHGPIIDPPPDEP